MDPAISPVLGRTTSPLVGPEALSILSTCKVVTTSLYRPNPYSSFLAASKGCQPVATIIAPTFSLKSWGSCSRRTASAGQASAQRAQPMQALGSMQAARGTAWG